MNCAELLKKINQLFKLICEGCIDENDSISVHAVKEDIENLIKDIRALIKLYLDQNCNPDKVNDVIVPIISIIESWNNKR